MRTHAVVFQNLHKSGVSKSQVAMKWAATIPGYTGMGRTKREAQKSLQALVPKDLAETVRWVAETSSFLR